MSFLMECSGGKPLPEGIDGIGQNAGEYQKRDRVNADRDRQKQVARRFNVEVRRIAYSIQPFPRQIDKQHDRGRGPYGCNGDKPQNKT
jgi:hypothetical protein